jgi:flagellar biosynthesis protein FlhA
MAGFGEGRVRRILMQTSLAAVHAERLNAAVPLAIMMIVLMMVLPVPAYVLDLLISLNITLSVITLITTMYITRPVQLSVYPSLLLLLTLLRLSLNVSSTQLILLDGQEGTDAAGDVIQAFGNFVVGGNLVIWSSGLWCSSCSSRFSTW